MAQMYALDNVDLEVRSGEFLTLLGPSGSGKTTLLMAIAGFNRPDAGSIRFGDSEMILTPPHRAQCRHGVPELCPVSAYDGCQRMLHSPLSCAASGVARNQQQRVAEALATVQLSDLR